jgi:hypothetical protein
MTEVVHGKVRKIVSSGSMAGFVLHADDATMFKISDVASNKYVQLALVAFAAAQGFEIEITVGHVEEEDPRIVVVNSVSIVSPLF